MTGWTRRRLAASGVAILAAPALLRNAGAAPLSGDPSDTSGLYRFTLGAFTVTAILDAAAMIDGPWPIVGEDRPRTEVEALMRENRLPPDRFKPGFTPILVDTGRERVLFDTGNGEVGFVKRPAGGRLAERLRAAGHDPGGIDHVVLTHCHTDHIGGLMEAGRPAFPNATIAVGAAELDFWTKDARLGSAPEGNEHTSALVVRSHLVPQVARIRTIRPGEEVVPGIAAVAAPGHTPGHLAYHVESAGRRMLIWGDCAHHEVTSLARPDWHALFDMDKAMGAATRRDLYGMAAADEILVAGYHTAFPSLGYVVAMGTGYRWIPVSYQLDP
ncbi:MBL fold metallo-hydrolase [Methylobacterium sp. Leaf466]|uniref:MBL fold metallo-hydrolase n=1 Tax=Methylobacterium sp. Leaf466 TaxID=1736386 RepID=UPI00070099D6|nr:MBL fold metallo-hydrolase [Methylobacterium sp. Leaf466]KQT77894.1 MBL fold metallo-hydrolase [Methylobacterium sp. Leaf466]